MLRHASALLLLVYLVSASVPEKEPKTTAAPRSPKIYAREPSPAISRHILSDDTIRASFFHAFLPDLKIMSSTLVDENMDPMEVLREKMRKLDAMEDLEFDQCSDHTNKLVKEGEHKKASQKAAKMLVRGRPLEEIAECCGLTKEEVKAMKTSASHGSTKKKKKRANPHSRSGLTDVSTDKCI
jgi:hypothetical protein